jgi:predicted nucleotidyltransferase
MSIRRAEVNAMIAAHRDEIVDHFAVRSLSLFGSVARNEARPYSDVDLLMEFDGPTTFDGHMGLSVI